MENLKKLLKEKKELEKKIKELKAAQMNKEELDGDDNDEYIDLITRLHYIEYDIKKCTCDYVSSSGVCYDYDY